uniref:Non-specific lipid-transfer protein n=1 Tax=Chenopodium quinoa TaxID=63459 RepID=A0A803MHX6_CHEQI
MASSAFLKLACAVLMCMVVIAPHAEAALTCSTVTKDIAQCISYLKGGDSPSDACCSGVKTLKSLASTPEDKKTACNCLKTAAASVSGLDATKAAALPGKCGVSIPYSISPQTDCSNSLNMASSAILRVLCAVIVCIMVIAPYAEAAINCGMVSQHLAPCIGFLENGQGPTAACCTGVRALKTEATTTQDKRTACRCMKSAATAFPAINQKNVAALPNKCGVSIPGAVGPQTDCSQYSSFLFLFISSKSDIQS